MTWHQHVPVIVFLDGPFEVSPAFIVHGLGNRRLVLDIYQSVGDDGELAMAGRQGEMVHKIAIGVGMAKNAGARINRQLKNKAALFAFTSGGHANFHHALPDETAVAGTAEIADGVEHQVSKATSIG